MRPIMSVNGSVLPVMCGVSASAVSNANIWLQRVSSSDYRHKMVTGSSALSCDAIYNSGAYSDAKVVAFATQQSTRKGYVTKDGITVTESGPVAVSDFGDACSMTGGKLTSENGMWARFGNISGVKGSVAVSTNTMVMYEMHFFKGNPLVDNATEVQAVIAELKTKYGI